MTLCNHGRKDTFHACRPCFEKQMREYRQAALKHDDERKRLRAALLPFAKLAPEMPWGDTGQTLIGFGKHAISYDDIRNAAEVMGINHKEEKRNV